MGVGCGHQGSEQIRMSSRLEEGLQGRQRWARQSGNETEGRQEAAREHECDSSDRGCGHPSGTETTLDWKSY